MYDPKTDDAGSKMQGTSESILARYYCVWSKQWLESPNLKITEDEPGREDGFPVHEYQTGGEAPGSDVERG